MRLSEAIEKKGLASRNISQRFSSPYKFYQIEESDCCCAWCDGWCSSIYIFFHSNTTPRSDADAAASRHNNQALFNLLLRHAASSSSRGKRKYVFNRHTIFFGVQSQCSDGKGSLMMILLFFTLREEILVRAQIFFSFSCRQLYWLVMRNIVLNGNSYHSTWRNNRCRILNLCAWRECKLMKLVLFNRMISNVFQAINFLFKSFSFISSGIYVTPSTTMLLKKIQLFLSCSSLSAMHYFELGVVQNKRLILESAISGASKKKHYLHDSSRTWR